MKAWKQLVGVVFIISLAACAMGGQQSDKAGKWSKAPPGGDYKAVSDLVPLPAFLPGMGALYVQPKTLPEGPFLAYDRDNKLVSTIYMIPLADMDKHKNFDRLQAVDKKVVATQIMYNAGHPGVPEPHYHIVLWHVSPDKAKVK